MPISSDWFINLAQLPPFSQLGDGYERQIIYDAMAIQYLVGSTLIFEISSLTDRFQIFIPVILYRCNHTAIRCSSKGETR